LLAGAELVLEERVVLGADYGEVVAHGFCSLVGCSAGIGVVKMSLSVNHRRVSLCVAVRSRGLSPWRWSVVGSCRIHCRAVVGFVNQTAAPCLKLDGASAAGDVQLVGRGAPAPRSMLSKTGSGRDWLGAATGAAFFWTARQGPVSAIFQSTRRSDCNPSHPR
jgi:hypothetical protein